MPKQTLINNREILVGGSGSILSLSLMEWNAVIGICVGLLSGAYLLRRWYIQEKTGWKKK